MSTSLHTLKVVPQEVLQNRIQTVKELTGDEHNKYSIVKDNETGEHYIRYTYHHLNLMEGGTEETFDHLLPVESDEVVAVALGEASYEYPDSWNRKYLQGSHAEPYLWFDPSSLQEKEDEQKGEAFTSMLTDFKKSGQYDEDSIKNLLNRIDQLWKDQE
ncbi:hypothetical protein PP175_22465 [Aneurinibacillus sp. Ricciae_BoGa-3]|uniref:hypothetical protein n=1 Tax=Aneurinibacillus sp. Ricciae_BoGa-3 TaxID=3022697 RepID=UPI002341C989|nr:hypothetical protein [Aneurinibacillus sp. Ricciae_BoGa-3]WCK54047.1 hypothetical protein PP175_22465 [Aneurinibacillus sp. Ricciae_BoGa-3]